MLFKRIRYGIFLLSVLLSGCGSSAERLPTPAEVLPDTGLYTRITPEEDSAKNMRTIYQNKKDTSDLIYLYYWDDGSLMGTSISRKGKNEGVWYGFSQSGNNSFKITYKKDIKVERILYYETKEHPVFSIDKFDKEGKPLETVRYDSTGAVLSTMQYFYDAKGKPLDFRFLDNNGKPVQPILPYYIAEKNLFFKNRDFKVP